MMNRIFSALITMLIDKQINECSMDADKMNIRLDCGDEELIISARYQQKPCGFGDGHVGM